MPDTLPARAILPRRLSETKEGEVFFSLGDDRRICIAGTIFKAPMMADLQGAAPFTVIEKAKARPGTGYAIETLAFVVDPGSAQVRRSNEDCRPGELVRFNGGLGIACIDRNQERYVLAVDGEQIEEERPAVLVAFSRWHISLEEDQNCILFATPAPQSTSSIP